MARQVQAVEVNTFVKGLITEASPLTFPDNASLDEENFVLLRDGSRERRLGMDYEDDFQEVSTEINAPEGNLAISTYSWDNAGGVPEKTLLVIQTGLVLKIFDPDQSPLSSGQVYSENLINDDSSVFSYANVDGTLVIATGQKDIQILSWDGASVTKTTASLKTRDLWGVEDKTDGVDLLEGQGVTIRPSSLSDAHCYNLRNQTWAIPRERGDDTTDTYDPILYFQEGGAGYPSNSDNVHYALYPNANDDRNRTGDQFFRRDLINNPPGSFPAPKGYFVIDAMERGASRLQEAEKLYQNYTELTSPIASLPEDRTPGGPSCVQEYAGRVWYGGFSGQVEGGDNRSPRLSSYIFYSQLVRHQSDINACYQEGDPTSKENPDLLDTDGGFIKVDGAYNIQALVNVGAGLLVVAENGVWMVSGGSDYGFSANNNMRRKISEHGVQSPGSVVLIDNTVMFWADDAIYHVAPDQFGDYQAQNLTQTTIQTLYDQIPPVEKYYAQGAYDSYDRKVRWVYNNQPSDSGSVKELVLDMTLGAFYTSSVESLPGTLLPRLASPVEVPPFRLNQTEENITDNGEQVVYLGEEVTTPIRSRGSGSREIAYVTLTSLSPMKYTFSTYRDESFRDWVSANGAGIDAPAFLVTGYLSGGDFLRKKQVPYIKFFFRRTEDGFTDDGTGNLSANNESSCLVQAQWNWANSAASNRWGRTFQAYRYKRLYMPTGAADEFDNGFEVIETKSKLRGHGTVLSLKISSEPEKDLRLLGWSMVVGANGNV
tara:strand:+ start:9024 stop:11330 length:2307 start_codon:yes stop_codon:yes gene_type:complete